MYELRKHFTEIKNFVSQCPFLEKFCVEFDDGFEAVVIVSEGILAELSFESSTDVAVEENIGGEVSIKRHNTYRIKLSQNAANTNDRVNLFEFIANFHDWLDFAHFNGLTAGITESEDAKVWADSFRDVSNMNNNDHQFVIQLHIVDAHTIQKYKDKY